MQDATLKAQDLCVVISLSFVLATGAIGKATGDKPQSFGDATVLATVPTPPGFPEGIAVHGNLVYVAGPATFGTGGDGQPSRVIIYASPFPDLPVCAGVCGDAGIQT